MGPARRRPGRSRAGAGASCPSTQTTRSMANVEPQSDDEDWHSESRGSANRPRTTARSGRITRSGASWPAATAARDTPGSACGCSSASAPASRSRVASPPRIANTGSASSVSTVDRRQSAPIAVRPIRFHRHVQPAVGLGRDRQPAGHGDDLVADLAVGTKGHRPGDRMNRQAQRARREAGSPERLDIRGEAGLDHRFGRGGCSVAAGWRGRRRTARRRRWPRR